MHSRCRQIKHDQKGRFPYHDNARRGAASPARRSDFYILNKALDVETRDAWPYRAVGMVEGSESSSAQRSGGRPNRPMGAGKSCTETPTSRDPASAGLPLRVAPSSNTSGPPPGMESTTARLFEKDHPSRLPAANLQWRYAPRDAWMSWPEIDYPRVSPMASCSAHPVSMPLPRHDAQQTAALAKKRVKRPNFWVFSQDLKEAAARSISRSKTKM